MRLKLVVFLIFSSLLLVAQPDAGDPNSGNKPGVPIGGIELLIAAGVVFGVKNAIDKKNNK